MTNRIRRKNNPRSGDKPSIKKPYLQRGRNANFGKCKICNEYFPKQRRTIRTNKFDSKRNEIVLLEEFVECKKHPHHGETVIETKRIFTTHMN